MQLQQGPLLEHRSSSGNQDEQGTLLRHRSDLDLTWPSRFSSSLLTGGALVKVGPDRDLAPPGSCFLLLTNRSPPSGSLHSLCTSDRDQGIGLIGSRLARPTSA